VKKVGFVVLIVLILVFVFVLYLMQKGPDTKQFERLLNPVVSQLPNQNMLIVEAKGDPGVSGRKAMKLLYKTYYSLKGVPKSFKMNAPRARWPLSFDAPKDQWIGLFALPIPAEIKTLPVIKNPDKQNIYIAEWEYGTVAEILHKGSYDSEQPTIKRLYDYIKQQGYTIIGEHEEDYIKGPGMFGAGNPSKYLTIIRYRVTKKI
jgi:hypothetical protein